MTHADLPAGLHERLVTRELRAALVGVRAIVEAVDPAEQPGVLSAFVAERLARALEETKPDLRADLTNQLLALLDPADSVDPGARGAEQLIAIATPEAPGVWGIKDVRRPKTPLTRPALLTNSPSDPKLGFELREEIASADRVDLLCAFIKWYGLRVLEDDLRRLTHSGKPLRVLTTTYMGATDRSALDRLVNDLGAQVRINYETRSTRLHAKAWLLRRASGFDTAYVGSSNLSRAALLDGLEWNVRLSGSHTPELLAKFEATFDSYWADPSFVVYDPAQDGDRLDEALARAGGGGRDSTLVVSGLQVRAYPHQEAILEKLRVERETHGHHRNLVVAATGTGKTVVAALDYARMLGRPSLLFVAHRREILEQARRTYREVLADGTFGELHVGGEVPRQGRHVFASIQSLSRTVAQLDPEQFQVVVVDEFHHAEATTYQRVLERLRPQELLGLTATPERTDGVNVRAMFDGRTAAELRLWDALEEDLLCPFHYFGVSDATDLSQLTWSRGDYDVTALEGLYTSGDARVRIVLRELRDKISDLGQMRALGFCVSIRHAEFMAKRFNAAGIPALAVSGRSTPAERAEALQALRERRVNALFAVDLFNEGLDVPDVDTLLLLRPTQSATVFLQQLGRGLRRTPDKPVLTVLDFIGQQRREFRFDLKYMALTGATRKQLVEQVDSGFAFLPSGCEILLDRVAHQVILDNVRQALRVTRKELVSELRDLGDTSLSAFLESTGRGLGEVVRRGGWTGLRRDAGLPTPTAGPQEEALLKRMPAFAHVDDVERAQAYKHLAQVTVPYEELPPRVQQYARMLFFSLWPDAGGHVSFQSGLTTLRDHASVVDELLQVLDVGLAGAAHVSLPLEEAQTVTLRTHAHYSREEILAGIGYAHLKRTPKSHMTGVVWSEETQTDALMVTMKKSERDYSPTTLYKDYALSSDLFHWESQNATSSTSGAGQRYASGDSRVLLLARERRTNEWGGPSPYLCLGPAQYVSHEGDRPMGITWQLRRSMPVGVRRAASLTA